MVDDFAGRPKMLFLIDGLGAFLTSFLLFVVLRNFEPYFGMPGTALTYLAAIALGFCMYSMACFLFLKKSWVPFIKAIALANLLYCVLTIWLVVANYDHLTMLGRAYFFGEFIVIVTLVYIELNVAAVIAKKPV